MFYILVIITFTIKNTLLKIWNPDEKIKKIIHTPKTQYKNWSQIISGLWKISSYEPYQRVAWMAKETGPVFQVSDLVQICLVLCSLCVKEPFRNSTCKQQTKKYDVLRVPTLTHDPEQEMASSVNYNDVTEKLSP